MEWQVELSLIILRVLLAVALFYHGTSKLFGWFGGKGLDRTAEVFAIMGFRPARQMVVVGSTIETVCSVLLLLGFLTPVALVLAISVFVNVFAVHIQNGYDQRNQGFEYELALIAILSVIALVGPGTLSLDSVLGLDYPGTFAAVTGIDLLGPWGLLLIAGGVLAGLLVTSTRRAPAAVPPVVALPRIEDQS